VFGLRERASNLFFLRLELGATLIEIASKFHTFLAQCREAVGEFRRSIRQSRLLALNVLESIHLPLRFVVEIRLLPSEQSQVFLRPGQTALSKRDLRAMGRTPQDSKELV
jgi:hypothetical protein